MKSRTKVYKKFGKNLTDPKFKTEFISPSYKATYQFPKKCNTNIMALYGIKSLATLDNLKCSIFNSNDRVEMHHVIGMKNLKKKLYLNG